MENFNSLYIFAAGIFILTFTAGLWLFEKYIAFLNKKGRFDIPDFRKHHAAPIPSSGGLIIGILSLTGVYFLMDHSSLLIPYFCSLVLLGVGFVDDHKDLSAKMKFLFQIIVALVTINFIGVVPLFSASYFMANYAVTFFFIIGFTNAFNLIDGVDGLAGSYAVFVLATFLGLFAIAGEFELMIFVLALMGGLLAFLKFNLKNAKIFMGDTGSLFLGFTIAFLSLFIIKSDSVASGIGIDNQFVVLIIVALLLLPVLDTLRVMFRRIAQKKSPFQADRTHLHHTLGNIGFNSVKIAMTFVAISALFLIIAFSLIQFKMTFITVLIVLVVTALVCYTLIFNYYMKVHANRISTYYNEVLSVNESTTFSMNKLNEQTQFGLLKKSS